MPFSAVFGDENWISVATIFTAVHAWSVGWAEWTMIAGVFGSLLLPPHAKPVPLRPLYLAIGVVGALFTLSTLLLRRTAGTSSLTYIGE